MQSFAGTAKSLHRGSRIVRRKIQHERRTVQLLLPVGQLLLDYFILQPIVLPPDKVRVLNRQFGQWRRPTVRKRLVKSSQFPEENFPGPAVRDDVMHRQKQNVIFIIEL